MWLHNQMTSNVRRGNMVEVSTKELRKK